MNSPTIKHIVCPPCCTDVKCGHCRTAVVTVLVMHGTTVLDEFLGVVGETASDLYNTFYSAPHCKRCTSYGNSVRLSVRLSVTRGYCVKTTARSTTQFAAVREQNVSSFVETKKKFPRDDPFPLKFWLQVTYPLLKASSFDSFCLVAPQP